MDVIWKSRNKHLGLISTDSKSGCSSTYIILYPTLFRRFMTFCILKYLVEFGFWETVTEDQWNLLMFAFNPDDRLSSLIGSRLVQIQDANFSARLVVRTRLWCVDQCGRQIHKRPCQSHDGHCGLEGRSGVPRDQYVHCRTRLSAWLVRSMPCATWLANDLRAPRAALSQRHEN